MSNRSRFALLLASTMILFALTSSIPTHAEEPDAAVQKIFDKVVGAIKAGDREAFVAHVSDAVKDATTQPIMDRMKKEFGNRFDKETKITYLCQLKQAGYQIHLWKLAFKDGGDDVVLRLAFQEGKVGGLFLQ